LLNLRVGRHVCQVVPRFG